MSDRYSLGGYRIAIQARSKKTLIVEGKDDKELFTRLRLASDEIINFDIDSIDIIQDNSLSGLGSKARIDYLLRSIPRESGALKKIRAFVDREWELLIDQNTGDPVTWRPPSISDQRFVTNGHSIENYGFSIDFVKFYVSHFGAGLLTGEIEDYIDETFSSLLNIAAAFSEIVRKRGIIARCDGLVKVGDIDCDGNRFFIKRSILGNLRQRGVEYDDSFLDEIETAYSARWSAPPFKTEAYLHAHGHIGQMFIWVGIAKIAEIHGFIGDICEQLAYGRRDEMRRLWHTWLIEKAANCIDLSPLDQVFSRFIWPEIT